MNMKDWIEAGADIDLIKQMNKALYMKLNELRADVIAQDWSKDGMLSLPGGRGYPYLSADKVKKNLAPLFVKHGLELQVDFTDLTQMDGIGNMSQHWVVKAHVMIIDVDTGFSVESTSYGEVGDTGDKGVSKAQTSAIKRWALAQFLLADGIDPDADNSIGRSTYNKLSAEEEAKVISKIQEKAIAKEKEKDEPDVQPQPVDVPDKEVSPAEAQLAKLKAEADAQKAAVAVSPKVEAQQSKYVPLGPQKKAIDRIVDTMTAKFKAGEIDEDLYNKMSKECEEIDSGKKATEFIIRYQSMVQ